MHGSWVEKQVCKSTIHHSHARQWIRSASTAPSRLVSFPPSIRRVPLILLLLFAVSTCNRVHPQRPKEPAAGELTARLTEAVRDAGGTHIWYKNHSLSHHGQGPGAPVEAVVTPAAYHAVMSAVQSVAHKYRLELRTSTLSAAEGGKRIDLLVERRGERIFHLHLREVPRMLRAAIVIDDMGHDVEVARKLLALQAPLTFSVLPHLRYTRMTAQEIHRSGREVMLHLPMEAEPGTHVPPGEGAILVGMHAAEVERIVEGDLASVPFVAGVNNHMGSRATQDAALMADVMKVLADHRLYFIDSRTTGSSQALEAARRQNLPAFYRAVFLDNTETVPYTLGQLRQFRETVERQGIAIAIGHPHATTIAALARFLPELERADIELVAPSQIVRLPEVASLHPPRRNN